VLGIRPAKPGFAEFDVAPRLCGLEWAEGVVPTPQGNIRAAWRVQKGTRFRLTITVPEGTIARFIPPKEVSGGKGRRLRAGTHHLEYVLAGAGGK
jgi:hypothetical protein